MATSMEPRMPDDFERMWADLAPLGRSAASGGYFRQPYTGVDGELRAWFVDQASARGLAVEADGLGNVVAWWRPALGIRGIVRDEPHRTFGDGGAVRPELPQRGVLTGSHLDSVLDGGAYD